MEMLLTAADARSVRDCVETLDGGSKQAIALAFFHGLSHGELAAHLARAARHGEVVGPARPREACGAASTRRELPE